MAQSAHFPERQLWCPHCHVNGCTAGLVLVLEAFRAVLNRPVIVDSAYRCEIYNASPKIMGAAHSEHVQGIAADLRIPGLSGAALEAIARQIPAIRGIGRDDFYNYIHIDLRETPAQWCYQHEAGKPPTVAYYAPRAPGAGVQA